MIKPYFKGLLCLSILIQLSFNTDLKQDSNETVTIDASKEAGIVSPNIMGFNIVYSYEGDPAWQSGSGKVPKMLNTVGAGQLRYPGGTVVTKYHWETPTGQGWKDNWDADFDKSKNTSPSTFMDIDEYLELTKKQGIEPLVGINMGSGMKHNRVQDGVDEALRLMKHCIAKGVSVKYYYLDNEPYQPDANFTYTAAQYAEMVNLYATEMRKIDKKIKIIVNTHPNSDLYTKELLEKAGKNIDLVDVHMYWKFKNATFENWKREGLMKHRGIHPYNEQKRLFEKIFADAGYPDIKLVILEWNVGPPGTGNVAPTEAQAALMVSEQFTQYIQSGLFMSCFWPVSWPDKTDWTSRALLRSKDDYSPNKMYNMFSLYTDVLGQQKISSTASNQFLISLAVKSIDGKTMWVYLINKDQTKDTLNINLSLEGFKAETCSATAFDSNDVQAGQLAMKNIKPNKINSSIYQTSIPRNSFMKITFKK